MARNLPILGSPQTAADVADRSSVCPWSTGMFGLDFAQPGARAWYDSIFKLYASWQVNFVKMDNMVGYAKSPTELAPYHQHDVAAARAAADASGRKSS